MQDLQDNFLHSDVDDLLGVLQWPASRPGEFINEIDEERITFPSEKGPIFVRTIEPISVACKITYLEVVIVDGGEKFELGIGFTSNLPEIGSGYPQAKSNDTVGLCMNNGTIFNNKAYSKAFDEKTENGDVVGCHLYQLNYGGEIYAICDFYRNEVHVGQQQLITADMIYPCIWVASGKTVLQVRFKGRGPMRSLGI